MCGWGCMYERVWVHVSVCVCLCVGVWVYVGEGVCRLGTLMWL